MFCQAASGHKARFERTTIGVFYDLTDDVNPEKKEMLREMRERDDRLFSILNDLIVYVLYMFLVVSIATYTIGSGVFVQSQSIRDLMQVSGVLRLLLYSVGCGLYFRGFNFLLVGYTGG